MTEHTDDDITRLIRQGIDLCWSGKDREAEPFFRSALDLAEKLCGHDAPEVIKSLFWLSRSVAPPDSLDPAENRAAITLLQRALKIAEATLGIDAKRNINLLQAIANRLSTIGEHEEAREHLMRALRLSEAHSGDGGDTVLILDSLVLNLLKLQRHAEALPYAERTLRLQELRTTELAHVGIGWAGRSLGICLMALGRNEEAIQHFERCLSLLKSKRPDRKLIFEDEMLGWIDELRKRAPR